MLVRKIVPSKLLNLFADGRSYGLMKIFWAFYAVSKYLQVIKP